MLPEDRALLIRLRHVNTAIADVVVELLYHLDDGELPADALRAIGRQLGDLSVELVDRADRHDRAARIGIEQRPTVY